MTREELIASIEQRLGLKVHDVVVPGTSDWWRGDHVLPVLSPNGAVLFTVNLGRNADGTWGFGGCGDLLKDHWSYFCRL